MLSQLHIENVAVIEKADLDLDVGLNVLTGETGAGKSILIDSINLALGERVSREIVRTGEQAAHVAALFTDVSRQAREKLAELGYACDEDGSLLITRDISADGRGSCRITGRPATVSIVREIGRLLVNIHGQHENQALFSPEKHLYYLDRYAGLETLTAEYHVRYAEMKRIERALARIETDESAKTRKLDLLRYQIDEIRSASLRLGEEEDLRAQKAHILNAGRITEALQHAYAALDGGESDIPGAQELVSAASSDLDGIVEYCPELGELAGRLSSLSLELDDCVAELRTYAGEPDTGEGNIDDIEQRLDTIYRLKMKYGGSIEAALGFLADAENELESIETSDETARKLGIERTAATTQAKQSAAALTRKRTEAAREMQRKIMDELRFLEMPGVRFQVDIRPLDSLGPEGADGVEFMISANPGSPLRPIARIASGGEISRIMLAVKTVLADHDDIDTLIFDEIDTGVSGRAAQKIGMKLRQVSQNRQVLCVTHLAQIASQAERHILIEKTVEKENTFTKLRTLDYSGRRQELARIIGGVNITPITLETAAEMLETAGYPRPPADTGMPGSRPQKQERQGLK